MKTLEDTMTHNQDRSPSNLSFQFQTMVVHHLLEQLLPWFLSFWFHVLHVSSVFERELMSRKRGEDCQSKEINLLRVVSQEIFIEWIQKEWISTDLHLSGFPSIWRRNRSLCLVTLDKIIADGFLICPCKSPSSSAICATSGSASFSPWTARSSRPLRRAKSAIRASISLGLSSLKADCDIGFLNLFVG